MREGVRKGERPFGATKYGKRKYKPETVAKRMLARGYCQVSRRFGHVSRVDVTDEELLVRIGECVGSTVPRTAESWYDFYRRCMSRDVITDVPEPIMYMIRNPGKKFVYRPPGPSDEEFVAMMVELGLVGEVSGKVS